MTLLQILNEFARLERPEFFQNFYVSLKEGY